MPWYADKGVPLPAVLRGVDKDPRPLLADPAAPNPWGWRARVAMAANVEIVRALNKLALSKEALESPFF